MSTLSGKNAGLVYSIFGEPHEISNYVNPEDVRVKLWFAIDGVKNPLAVIELPLPEECVGLEQSLSL